MLRPEQGRGLEGRLGGGGGRGSSKPRGSGTRQEGGPRAAAAGPGSHPAAPGTRDVLPRLGSGGGGTLLTSPWLSLQSP